MQVCFSDNHLWFPLFLVFLYSFPFSISFFIFFPITLMGKQYTIEIQTETLNCSFLQRGYIKCDVSRKSTPLVKRHFLSCLHCSTLGSPSWFFPHKSKVEFDPSPDMVQKFRDNLHRFVEDIHSEVDFLFETGRLFQVMFTLPFASQKSTVKLEKRHSLFKPQQGIWHNRTPV